MKNSNIKKILYSILFILIVSISVFAQTKKPIPKKNNAKRSVTVTHKQGYLLIGTFYSSSSVGIQVVIDNKILNLRWNEISQIFFPDSALNQLGSKNRPQIKNNPAIENALKSLRKLAAATEVGINRQEYNRRVIDAKAEIEEFLPEINDSYIKSEIKDAITYHQLAVSYWSLYVSYPDQISESKFDEKIQGYWREARIHLENATRGEPEK